MTLIYMGGNNENQRVASPESVPIHLNGADKGNFLCQTASKCKVIHTHSNSNIFSQPSFQKSDW